MKNLIEQPIIILGGFLISEEAYEPMANWLRQNINNDVTIINTSKLEWLYTSWPFGWVGLLDKVDKEVSRAIKRSINGKVTLIGHSSGGVMLRLYLSTDDFQGRRYSGKDNIGHLITLGSPHQAIKATKLRAFVDYNYPGSYFKEVKYISVGGVLDINGENATRFAKRVSANSYKSITGKNNSIGDGLVPLSSSLLKDSRQIILKDTSHSKIFGKDWYGSLIRVSGLWSDLV
tara:strand:- start:12158 stop:12853 length:696 start_codon:yes stop_codon:yes gene_type:complete